MEIGDKVKWKTANGTRYGVIIRKCGSAWFVRLVNRKCIIAEEESLTLIR